MERSKSLIKPKVLSVPTQLTKILKEYENIKYYNIINGTMVVVLQINPTKLSRIYDVKIKYKVGKKPIINILNLEIDKEIKLPHTYTNNELCLYYPRNKEWTKYMYLSDTIIPWISEWLYFYQVWEITGEWYGGGIHPTCNKKNRN